ncbi:fluoroquinolone transport system permease protein [Planifilum fimeticola]|jgi:fluoroquinolone transport system permease protein|uniref:Fluoroquinolone transport system permease protein n=1 Tax=Planifilum fimeticola TaxID=201975 RepID=A0A2T0LIM5_9BACL|nr:hypothetical protein [Planifilum fimeticola]PRX42293.1 fluoroquinolone transport system permease protein [Planifilum fimeticola]
MKRIFFLLHADLKNILRDPLLFLAAAGPLLLAVLFRLGTPVAAGWLERMFAFDLTPYYGLIQAVVLQLVPFVTGMVAGFLMLEERDEGLIPLFAVTPLMKSGYLLTRMFTPVLLSFIYSICIVHFASPSPVDEAKGLAASLLWTMEAAMLALLLAAFAANKVEGLALTKGAGILVFTPLAVQFLPRPWDVLILVFPTFWPSKVLFAKETPTWFALGLMIHLGIVWRLYRSFQKRVE